MCNKYLTPLQIIALKIWWDNNTEWKLFPDLYNNHKQGRYTIQTLFNPLLGSKSFIFLQTFKLSQKYMDSKFLIWSFDNIKVRKVSKTLRNLDMLIFLLWLGSLSSFWCIIVPLEYPNYDAYWILWAEETRLSSSKFAIEGYPYLSCYQTQACYVCRIK